MEGVGRLINMDLGLVYQGEFSNGKKSGRGRLETYKNSFALSSYKINDSQINHTSFEKTIQALVDLIKKDVIGAIHKGKRKAEKICYNYQADLNLFEGDEVS